MPKPLWQPASEPRLQRRPRKRPHIEDKVLEAEHDDCVDIQALNEDSMRTQDFYDLLVLQKPRADQS